jgi:excisionase family DNA binding protein
MTALSPSGAGEHRTLLLGYDEAAQRVGTSNRTLRSLIYGGALPSVCIGHRRLIAVADLEAFVEKLREESRDERHPGEPRASSVDHLPYTPVAGSLPCRRNIRWVVAFNARISIIGVVKA